MKQLMKAVIILLSLGASIQANPYYIEMQAMNKIDDSLVDAGARYGSMISFRDVSSGVFYWSDAGRHGTFGNSIWDFTAPTAGLEFYYNFTLGGSPSQPRLIGTVLTIRVKDSDNIISGKRMILNQPVKLNEAIDLDIGLLPDGREKVIQLTITDTKPASETICAPGWLRLISLIHFEGKMHFKHGAGRVLENTIEPISTSLTLPVDDAASQYLKYDPEISFLPALTNIDSSTTTTLNFIRRYAIDTLHYRRNEVNLHIRYESTYTKEITLVPGRILKIIIPPDTPSVRGFTIEDTLIINPGPRSESVGF